MIGAVCGGLVQGVGRGLLGRETRPRGTVVLLWVGWLINSVLCLVSTIEYLSDLAMVWAAMVLGWLVRLQWRCHGALDEGEMVWGGLVLKCEGGWKADRLGSEHLG